MEMSLKSFVWVLTNRRDDLPASYFVVLVYFDLIEMCVKRKDFPRLMIFIVPVLDDYDVTP
jgi:hypothetical protein